MNLFIEQKKLDKMVELAIKSGRPINSGEVLKQSKLVDKLLVLSMASNKEKRPGA